MKPISKLTLLALLLIQLSCGREKKEQQSFSLGEDIVPVTTAQVETSVRAKPIRVSGTVASLEEARLSFKMGGIVSKIYVKEGQTVHKGQILAVLDQTEIEAQVNQARYATEKAERDMQRVQKMVNDTAATMEQLQNATTGYHLSQQNLRIATFNQSYSKIVSPLDGIVTRKMINEGELTGPGTPALIITSSRKNDWVIRAGISDKDWARIKIGDKAVLMLDAYPEVPFSGSIANIAQAADPVSKLYEIEIRIDPSGKRLASGLYAKIELSPSQQRSYAVIPVEALVEGNGNDGYVYVNDKGKARRVPVTIGYLEHGKVLITGGLEGIPEVISSGSGFLTENIPVKTVKQ
jgi:multidrug efflux system membrane fusion protein